MNWTASAWRFLSMSRRRTGRYSPALIGANSGSGRRSAIAPLRTFMMHWDWRNMKRLKASCAAKGWSKAASLCRKNRELAAGNGQGGIFLDQSPVLARHFALATVQRIQPDFADV